MELETRLVKYLRGSWVEILSMLFANFDPISQKSLELVSN